MKSLGNVRCFFLSAATLLLSHCAQVSTTEQLSLLSFLLNSSPNRSTSSETVITVTPERGIQITSSSLTVIFADTKTLSLRLASQPSQNVTIHVGFDTSKLTVNSSGTSPFDLIFTTSNFNTLQTINLDALTNANDSSSLTLSTQSSDSVYNNLTASIPVTIQQASASIVTSASTVSLEGGGTGSFGVRLNLQPTANVGLLLSFTNSKLALDASTSSPLALTFTSGNYSSQQTVNLRSLSNVTENTNISFIASSTDGRYSGLTKSVTASISNQTRSLVFTPSPATLSLNAGETGSFTVALSSVPTSDVTVNFTYTQSEIYIKKSSDSNFDTDGSYSLTFTSGNNTAQTVQVKAVSNFAVSSGTISLGTTVPASPNGDSSFNGLTASLSYSVSLNVPIVLSGDIQNGTQNSSSQTANYSLGTTVDPSTSFVICNFQTNSSDTVNATTCQLNGAGTQVIVTKGAAAANNVTTNYYVMNFSSGISVQRGATTLTSGTGSANLTQAVDSAKSFIISYARTSTTGNTSDNVKQVQVSFTNSTTLGFSCNGCTNTTVEWQVVQWHTSSVQSGIANLSHGTSTVTANLGSAVDLTKSFLIFNNSYTPNGGVGYEQNYYTAGSFSSTSQISFQRGGTGGDLAIQYFVVSIPSGLVVKSNSFAMTTSDVGICDTIPSGGVSNYLKSMMIASNRIGAINQATNVDSASLTYEFQSAGCSSAGGTHLRIKRDNVGTDSGTPHDVHGTYFLLEFN